MFETLTKGFPHRQAAVPGPGRAFDEATVDEAPSRTCVRRCSRPTSASTSCRISASGCARKAVGVIVKVRASSKEKDRRVSPEDHFVKLCHDELIELMGPIEPGLKFAKKGLDGQSCSWELRAGLGQDDDTVGKLCALPREAAQAAAAGRGRRLPPRRHRTAADPGQAARHPRLRRPGRQPAPTSARRPCASRPRPGAAMVIPLRHRGPPRDRRAASCRSSLKSTGAVHLGNILLVVERTP